MGFVNVACVLLSLSPPEIRSIRQGIWVNLPHQFAVRSFDFRCGSTTGDTQNCIVSLIGHFPLRFEQPVVVPAERLFVESPEACIGQALNKVELHTPLSSSNWLASPIDRRKSRDST